MQLMAAQRATAGPSRLNETRQSVHRLLGLACPPASLPACPPASLLAYWPARATGGAAFHLRISIKTAHVLALSNLLLKRRRLPLRLLGLDATPPPTSSRRALLKSVHRTLPHIDCVRNFPALLLVPANPWPAIVAPEWSDLALDRAPSTWYPLASQSSSFFWPDALPVWIPHHPFDWMSYQLP